MSCECAYCEGKREFARTGGAESLAQRRTQHPDWDLGWKQAEVNEQARQNQLRREREANKI